ncbi:MAG: TetR/AcrR family transcriptional regulator [Desulfobacterales bacterium]|nr:TetR/AcrR family transcriptional regulator [Desulfobacterales bacterium]
MPRTSMNEAEITRTKEKILDISADIINEEGYQNLSMRKIGTRAGMTAANLYNYYANKDEINIAIRLRAGRLLYDDLLAAYNSGSDMADKIWLMMKAYITYGLTKPNYYSIMFDMPTPKYAHYVGTPLEALAREEKVSSEQSVALLYRCAKELKGKGFGIPDDPDLFMTIVWGQLHGLVSLYNNNSIGEIVDRPEQIIQAAARKAYEIFFRQPLDR